MGTVKEWEGKEAHTLTPTLPSPMRGEGEKEGFSGERYRKITEGEGKEGDHSREVGRSQTQRGKEWRGAKAMALTF